MPVRGKTDNFAIVNQRKETIMKRIMLTLAFAAAMLAAQAMGYAGARSGALFLTDKMAYELGLNEAQYDAVYEINFDYLVALGSRGDVAGSALSRRNRDLGYVLTAAQYSRLRSLDYFYAPARWSGGVVLKVYTRYPDRSRMYFEAPRTYLTYKGGHGRPGGSASWYKGKSFKSSVRPSKAAGHAAAKPSKPAKPSAGKGHAAAKPSKPAKPSAGKGHGAVAKPSKQAATGTRSHSSGAFRGARK